MGMLNLLIKLWDTFCACCHCCSFSNNYRCRMKSLRTRWMRLIPVIIILLSLGILNLRSHILIWCTSIDISWLPLLMCSCQLCLNSSLVKNIIFLLSYKYIVMISTNNISIIFAYISMLWKSLSIIGLSLSKLGGLEVLWSILFWFPQHDDELLVMTTSPWFPWAFCSFLSFLSLFKERLMLL
jgi:hypothetical protein